MFKRKLSSLQGSKSAAPARDAAATSNNKKVDKNSKKTNPNPSHPPPTDLGDYVNRERLLILSSRGTSHLHRHLLADLVDLLPHSKKDSKLDTKDNLSILNEVSELKNCSHTLFLETRKHSDLYLWMAATPHGPSAKFLVQNIFTMADVRLTGNCLKGSRPLLVFDAEFDASPAMALMKQLLSHVFGTPKGHPKSKPFVDHCLSFFIVDHRIWFRHYQIVYDPDINQIQKAQQQQMLTPSLESLQALQLKRDPILIEIGPRFVLNPIKVFHGSFGGPVLWENPHYQSPNAIRAIMAARKGMKYDKRIAQYEATELHKKAAAEATVMNPIDSMFSGTEVDREEKVSEWKKRKNGEKAEEKEKGTKKDEDDDNMNDGEKEESEDEDGSDDEDDDDNN